MREEVASIYSMRRRCIFFRRSDPYGPAICPQCHMSGSEKLYAVIDETDDTQADKEDKSSENVDSSEDAEDADTKPENVVDSDDRA